MNILDFANPSALWWALLALPILGLYILKVRLRRVSTTTLLFWNQLFDEKKPRAWWQRLRHWLSLLLQLAFLMLLVAALLDPLWSWQKQQQRRIVLVLDNSASMQAVGEDGMERLQLAKQAAISVVRSLRDGDQMAVVSAGGRPQVVWGMTHHQRWLVDAIEGLPATDAPSAIEPSITLARRLLTGLEGAGETIVLTDGQSPDLTALLEPVEDATPEDRSTPPPATLKIYAVGEPRDNIAITRYQVRRSLIDAIGYQVLIDVTNFSDAAAACRLELKLDEELVDVLPLELQPNETVTRIINHASIAGGRMVATLDVEDALSVDNTAIALLPIRQPVPVQLFSDGNLFVHSVLKSIPLVDLTVADLATLDKSPNQLNSRVIQVFDRVVPAILPRGPVLVVDPQNECDLWKVTEDLESPIVASVDGDSPLTQHVRLDNVLFPGAKRLEFKTAAQTLIRDPFDAPLLARFSRTTGDVVVLTCSLDQGDLPLRIAFPVLMKNVIEWFQGDSNQLRPAASSGEVLTLTVPAKNNTQGDMSDEQSAASVNDASETDSDVNGSAILVLSPTDDATANFELVAPDGSATPIATENQQVTIGPLLQTGLWFVRSRAEPLHEPADQASPAVPKLADAPVLSVACNLSSFQESDLRPRSQLPNAASELATLKLGGRSLWFYLTLVAAGLIAIEWWLYHRRIVG